MTAVVGTSTRRRAIARRFHAAALAVLVAMAGRSAHAAAITAPSAAVVSGDVFTVSIAIADAIDVSSWQLDLTFDPAILEAVSMSEGPFLSSFSGLGFVTFTPGVIDNAAGAIGIVSGFYFDLPPLPSGSGVLADVVFHALAPGSSPLQLSNVFVNGLQSDVDVVNGLITVAAAPGGGGGQPPQALEPAAVLTLGIGLAAWRSRARARAGRPSAGSVSLSEPRHACTRDVCTRRWFS